MARRESVPGRSLVWVLAIALGITSAGTLVHHNSETPAEARPAATGRAHNASEARPAEVTTPSALLRPLALLAKEVGPEPLFWLKDPGKPALSAAYDLPAAPEGTYIYCPQLAPQAFAPAPGGTGFVPVGEWRAADYECGLVLKVHHYAAAHRVSVDIVVATLPDWVDSSLQWTFDPVMDALQAAAGQMGYSLVDFDMVDTDPDPASVQPKGSVWPFPRVHELTPGAVLFRKANGSDGESVLLLLLVGETATAGAHQQALANALDFALLWPRHIGGTVTASAGRRSDAVRVLGPTYSGSAVSLREAFDEARARHRLADEKGRAWFDVVTGSASSPTNPAWLAVDGLATFRSVTRSDPEVLTAVARFLGQSRREWFCGNHVALLVEGNTTWGRSFFSQKNLCTSCNGDGPEKYYEDYQLSLTAHPASNTPLPCATLVPFPLHISRLRNAAQHTTSAVDSATLSQSVVSLDLSESIQPGDLIPSETPEVTSATVETMVSGMMRVLRDRRISAVGVLATDKRDHVYLAEEIARLHPNVLQFTLESALMYLHPDVNGYMRGTIVASTYSLNERTQRFTHSPLTRYTPVQFGTSPAEGAFNALALLMKDPGSLIDYESPVAPGSGSALSARPCRSSADPRLGQQGCQPPVWISVVGRSALLPVTRDASARCADTWQAKGYVTCGVPADAAGVASGAGSNRAYSYLTARHLILILGAALLLVLIAYQIRVQARLDTNKPCAPVATPVPPTSRSPLAAPTPVQRLDAAASAYRDAVRNWLRSLLQAPDVQNTCAAEIAAGLLAMRAATLVIILGLAKLGAIYAADALAVPILPFWIVFDVIVGLGTLYLLWQARDTFWIKRDGVPARRVHLARLAALLALGCVLVAGVLQNEGAGGSGSSGLLLFLAAVCALASMLWDWDREIGTPVGLISHWRRFPVLLGILAFLWLTLDLGWRHWIEVDALLYADRTAAMSALLSPAANVSFITLAVFSWGGWAISRIGLLRLPETEVGVGPLIETAARSAGINFRLAFQEPAMTTGTLIVAPTLVVLLALAFGGVHTASVDGYPFSSYLLFGATAVIGVLTHTLANSTYLGFAVVYLLRCLAHLPGNATFKKLARDAISWRISFQRVRMIEMASLLTRLARVLRARVQEDPPKLIPASGCTCGQEDTARIQSMTGTDTNPTVVLLKEDWVQIDKYVRSFYTELQRTKWLPDFDNSLLPQDETQIYDDMEYVVFFHAAIVLRDLLTRLISGFTIVFCGLLALVMSHLFYTFQGRVYWLSFDAIVLAMATLIAVVFLSLLERDAILSTLWRTKPGRISLFSGLTWRMAAYAGILVATLFTVFFPELGGRLSSWLVPARSLIE